MLTHRHHAPVSPSRVVLLGSGGFIGATLAATLGAKNIPCEAIRSRSLDLTAPDAHQRLVALLRPTDTVVFAAAITSDRGRDFDAFMRNVRMAEQVCLALRARACAHLIYLSSDAVYDGHQIPLDEDSTREPLNLYALTHTAREMMLRDALATLDVPLCVLRPTSIYGPGDTHNNYGPNRFVVSALRDGKIVIYGRGEERRSHVFIDDAINLIMGCILHGSHGTLNLAAKPALSYAQIADLVKSACGGDIAFDYQPRAVPRVHRPYKPTQVFRFLYNLGRPIGPIVHRPYAVTAIFKAFPDFRSTPHAEGIGRYVSALRTVSAPAASTLS